MREAAASCCDPGAGTASRRGGGEDEGERPGLGELHFHWLPFPFSYVLPGDFVSAALFSYAAFFMFGVLNID